MRVVRGNLRGFLATGVVLLLLVGIVLIRWPGSQDGASWPALRYVEVAESSGLIWRHFAGTTARKLLPETMGSGVVVLDYDNDGKPDILLINSRAWPGEPAPVSPPRSALFRNMGAGRFAEATQEVGLDLPLFGMGGTAGDFDNDGWPDLFLTGVGGNRLLRNEQGQRFRDVTARAGVGGPGGWPEGYRGDFFAWRRPLNWSTSSTWLDYDGDGWLDLFVCNYITWSPGLDVEQGFRLASGERAYGPPRAFGGTHCFLYRNRGDGSFEDVSRAAGIEVQEHGAPLGKSLGVITCDVDEDGWPDLMVANDTVRNFFFHNVPDEKGGRRFQEIGEATGIAFADRRARGAMGIDWGPGCVDGRHALLIGNFADEPNTFMVQQRPRDLQLVDLASSEGIAGPSRPYLKFGVVFFDADLDGRLDFLTCNGHLEPDISRAHPEEAYAQAPQLFLNTGDGRPRFVLPGKALGKDLVEPMVGRGCAVVDLEGDGHLDLVVTANGGPVRLLQARNTTGNHWVRLRLEGDGRRSNRSAIGARVVLTAGGHTQQREVAAARGYLSQSELTITLGLGKVDTIDRVEIFWPGSRSGPPTVLKHLKVDQEHHIVQGK
jgi:hypothetical protein